MAKHGFLYAPPKIVDWKDETEDKSPLEVFPDDDVENLDPDLLNEFVLDLLFQRGADVNAGNNDRHTPLHYAAAVVNLRCDAV